MSLSLQNKFDIQLDPSISSINKINKVNKVIELGNKIYNFINNNNYKGMKFVKLDLTRENIDEFGNVDTISGRIQLNIELPLNLLVYVLLIHELTHNEIRNNFDYFCQRSNLISDSRIMKEFLVIKIEEFLVDVNYLIHSTLTLG